MLSTETRIELLARLGEYVLSDDEKWEEIQHRAVSGNAWFSLSHVSLAINNIATQFLQKEKLRTWITPYKLPEHAKKVGIVMAGNIPLVGFHDFLCGFMSGNELLLKLSSKDNILLPHLIHKLIEWQAEISRQIHISDNLKGCDAYIATGSNNTARYFEQYFGKYPHIIRKNRTSVAILDGTENDKDLEGLANDIFSYYGLGCRNVTQVCVPEGYDFSKLLNVFNDHEDLMKFHKYKNNYDYYLAIYMLNKIPYITNGSLLMIENALPFSAVGVLHYRFYADKQQLIQELQSSEDIQGIIGNGFVPFGTSQQPTLSDYADGIDTMAFLCSL
ncbi:MAG TPA: acyl-CoA reductase [Flavipsychrobacter sp.]|nr:acyl-CoA reductase [Flavipsychrobacter sp.]